MRIFLPISQQNLLDRYLLSCQQFVSEWLKTANLVLSSRITIAVRCSLHRPKALNFVMIQPFVQRIQIGKEIDEFLCDVERGGGPELTSHSVSGHSEGEKVNLTGWDGTLGRGKGKELKCSNEGKKGGGKIKKDKKEELERRSEKGD